jgi:protein CpxP
MDDQTSTDSERGLRMNRTCKLAGVIYVLGALIGLGTIALAGQAPGAGSGQTGRPPRMRPLSVEERLQRMSQRLNLTEDQKGKIRPILENEDKQIKAVRDDTSLSQPDRRAKLREIRQATRQQTNQILTPEQKAKWNEPQRRGRGRRWRGTEPPPQSQ